MRQKVWQKVANDIALQVSLGKWPVGTIIPGEIDLAKKYRVSRDTVRKALAALTDAGYFERKPHIGTRVKAKNRSGKFLHEVNDIRSIDRYGNTFPREIRHVEALVLEDAVAERLGVPSGSEMLRLENIRTASEGLAEPVVVTFVYIFPEARGVLELAADHPDELIVNLVEEVMERECVEVRQTFSATKMNERVAHYFQMPVEAPALKIIRNYLDERGKTIVVSESFHPADRFSFSVSVRKKTRFF